MRFEPQRNPKNFRDGTTVSWMGALVLALIIVFSAVPAALVADWLKPIDRLMALLSPW